MIPASGGAERKITSSFPLEGIYGRHLDWSPDGHSLAIVDKPAAETPFSIFLVSVSAGRTQSSDKSAGPVRRRYRTRIFPNGRFVAFKRTTSSVVNDATHSGTQGGKPRRLTNANGYILAHSWSADGNEIIFCSNRTGENALWRISANGAHGETHLIADGERQFYRRIEHAGAARVFSVVCRQQHLEICSRRIRNRTYQADRLDARLSQCPDFARR